ncbi:unnamed protein product [Effrenium voratum]|nr:unnamed protein product [Effrenium voratum]
MLVHNWTCPGVGPRRVSHLHLTSPERWMLRATLRFAMLVHSWTCPDVGPRRVSRTLPRPQNSSQYNGHLLYEGTAPLFEKDLGPIIAQSRGGQGTRRAIRAHHAPPTPQDLPLCQALASL